MTKSLHIGMRRTQTLSPVTRDAISVSSPIGCPRRLAAGVHPLPRLRRPVSVTGRPAEANQVIAEISDRERFPMMTVRRFSRALGALALSAAAVPMTALMIQR